MSMVDVADSTSSNPIPHDLPLANGPPAALSSPANDAGEEQARTPAPESHPMTATTSYSSHTDNQENADGSTAGSYGTRSRYRPGSRPNYADDKELDLEIEATGRYQKLSSKKSASAQNTDSAALALQQQNDTPPRNGFAAINANAPSVNANASLPKENIPGTSSFSALPAVPAPSKKRKQPGSSNTVANVTVNNIATKSRSQATASRAHIETNMMSFSASGARLNGKKELVADDGTTLKANDHCYFVCEPPGEPYYLARIMEFLHANNDPQSHVDAVRVNWYYRPKDIQRRVQDTRVVFSSMHSDTCPLTSLRGKCNIQHLSDVSNLDQYRTQKDSFWFSSLYDRYMHRYYEVIPTSKVINVPQHVKSVLDDRWKFILVEVGRGRELTSAVKTCKKCSQYAASHDSVDCAVCKNTYHMACIRPPLLKKPARGFAWACAACSRAQELRLEARNTPTLTDSGQGGDEELLEEEDDDAAAAREQATRESSVAGEPHPAPTAAQIAQANLWPYRYLGMHCRVEDALDYDDRIYPRASSRLGPRHQANVTVWHGRPVEFVKPADVKKKYIKSAVHKKDGKFSKETQAALEADKDNKLKRPKWVLEEPVGYISRGEDFPVDIRGKKEYTAQLTFRMPDSASFFERGSDDAGVTAPENREKIVDEYMQKARMVAPQYGILDCSTDFLTKAIEKLQDNNYDADKALEAMKNLSIRGDLKQPDLNREEVKRFEEGVAKYGSELHNVARHVSLNIKESRIVRFYYMWKKTERGRQIWGNFEGRRSKKESKRIEKDGPATKLLDDVADDHDDSAFDNDKAAEKKRGFECKFCATRKSRQWRRAPGTAPGTLVPADASSKIAKDKSNWLTLALCGKCGYLWRRYAIQYESVEEVAKKIAAAGGRASKRKIDEELMRTIIEAQGETGDQLTAGAAAVIQSAGVDVPSNIIETPEPPKKKVKPEQPTNGIAEDVPEKKKCIPEKPAEPEPLVPEMPRVRVHPCRVCELLELPGDELLKCRDCRLHVHGSCAGVSPQADRKPWFCDTCKNDHNTQVSTTYECVLCPIKYTAQELMEPLKVTHKKKTDREREKERLEREMVQEAGRRWRQEQEAAGRPVNPREALKRTAWNNWVHITCAMWTEEIKFGNADLFDEAEGVGFIPPERFTASCRICRTAGKHPTVACFKKGCDARFHVGCAHMSSYNFGFDIYPPKGTRKDAKSLIKLYLVDGSFEVGHATAVILCPHHEPDTYVHRMYEATDEGLSALQLFARNYKQVDRSTTGTVRRAAQFKQNTFTNFGPTTNVNRNASIHTVSSAPHAQVERLAGRSRNTSPAATPNSSENLHAEPESLELDSKQAKSVKTDAAKICCNCAIDVSPRWWQIRRSVQRRRPASPETSFSRMSLDGQSQPLEKVPHSTGRQEPDVDGPNGSHDTHRTVDHTKGVSPVNGVIKTEDSPDVPMPDVPRTEAEEVLYQCHKCHKQKLQAPSLSPAPSPVRAVLVEEEPDREPFFSPAPLNTTTPWGWRSGAEPDFQQHSHPVARPAPPQQSPWSSGQPERTFPSYASTWSTPPSRNGVTPQHPPGTTYHNPSPVTELFRPPHSSPYANGFPLPPASSGPPNRPASHHSPTTSFGFPRMQAQTLPQYPTSPQSQRYGQLPLPDHPTATSPHLRNGPPRTYPPPPPPPLEHHHSHGRMPGVDSSNSHLSFPNGPHPPPPRNYGPPPPPPPPSMQPSQAGTPTMSLSQIAQSAEVQLAHGHNGQSHGYGGSALHLRRGSVDSAKERPSTPAGNDGGRDREGEVSSAYVSGPGFQGASTSPSLRNLLG